MIKTLKYLWYFIASCCVMMALVITAARLTLPKVFSDKTHLSQVMQEFIGQPVQIESVTAKLQGIDPVIALSNVVVLDKHNHQALINIRQINVAVDLWHSLLNKKIKPGRITLMGAKLSLTRDDTGSYRFKTPFIKSTHDAMSPEHTLSWLMSHPRITLKDFIIDVNDSNNKQHQLNVQQATLVNEHHYHRLVLRTLMDNKPDTYAKVILEMMGESFADPKLKIKSYIQAKNIHVHDWLPQYGFDLSHLNTMMTWQKQQKGWRLQVPIMRATINKSAVYLRGEYNHPQRYLSVLTHIKQGQLTELLKPLKQTPLLSPKVHQWLTKAIKAGNNKSTTIVMHGRLPAKLYMHSEFSGMTLHYHPKWPALTELDTHLDFANEALEIKLLKGKISNNPIQRLTARIPRIGKDAVLALSGRLNADAAQLLYFAKSSPLKDKLKLDIDHIQAFGPAGLEVQLSIPLAKERHDIRSFGKLHFRGVRFRQLGTPIDVTDVLGTVSFKQNIYFADAIKAKIYGSPVVMRLDTSNNQPTLSMQGTLDMQQLSKYYQHPWLNYFNGQAPFHALITVHGQHHPRIHTHVESNLKGLDISLPEPFTKKRDAVRHYELDIHQGGDQDTQVRWRYGEILNAALIYKPGGKALPTGTILMGKQLAQLTNPNVLNLTGNIPTLNLQQWWDFYNQNASVKSNGVNWRKVVGSIQLNVDNFIMGEHQIPNLKLTLQPTDIAWQAQLNSEIINGSVYLPHDKDAPIEAILNKLNIQSGKENPRVSQLLPKHIPSFHLRAKDFIYNDIALKNLQLKVRSLSNSVKIEKLGFSDKHYKLDASGSWVHLRDGDKTQLQGLLTSDDLSKALHRINRPSHIDSDNAKFEFNFHWNTQPSQAKMHNLNGEMRVHIGRGRIKHLDDSTRSKVGLGKLLTIFSLPRLSHWLSLDFSDLTKKGYTFQSIQGHVNFDKGIARTKKIEVNSNIADMLIKGNVGFTHKTINLSIDVKPYVTSSLPLIATVAGGPIAGAVTLVVNKVMTPALQKVTGQRYVVTGNWDKPIISEPKKNH